MSSAGAPTVLVADDDADILELVATTLRRAGFGVVTATDGEEALAAARDRRPDAAVLDVMMPKANGFDVTRALRADPATADMAIMLLTASVQERHRATGFEAGADDFVRKPFATRDLVARVEALLSRRAAL